VRHWRAAAHPATAAAAPTTAAAAAAAGPAQPPPQQGPHRAPEVAGHEAVQHRVDGRVGVPKQQRKRRYLDNIKHTR